MSTTTAAAIPNTWSKGRNGDWLVRGKAGQIGANGYSQDVLVAKRDGTAKLARITRQVWTDGQVALYATSPVASQSRSRSRGSCHTGGDCSSMCNPKTCPCGDGSWFSCC